MDKIKVMIVEDEIIVAKHIEDSLQSLGYSVTGIVSSGEDAVELAAGSHPDIALMDIMLEGETDGISAAEIIRKRYNIPVIFLTAYSNEKTIHRAKTAKPYGYILKPFEETDLFTSIEIALHKHRIERRLVEETENALAAIIGGTEVFLEDGTSKHNPETLRRIESIRNAALIIKETIEEL
ncbi:MAG TPA: response regulator [Thermodesulfobacteriota bacterium]|jgi:CheY-like chemotaxis protein|nr:response regulator [Thermodesulfobacteriota bacterium]